MLASCLGNAALALPCIPHQLSCFRSYFDEQDESVRRQYYYLCNIITSYDMLIAPATTFIILDRYWPSTIAYKLAHQSDCIPTCEELQWPTYLIRPSHIFYLTVAEEERRRRIHLRSNGQSITDEEVQLENDRIFRAQLDNVYRRVPYIQVIDANSKLTDVVEKILALLRQDH